MEPRLIAITGPLKGTTIPLVDPETIIGRDPTNPVAVNDPLVSRKHCALRKSEGEGGAVQVADLESLNGTLVNGVPTREKTLDHGDRIKVGSSQFIFVTHPVDSPPGVPLTDFLDEHFTTTITVMVNSEDSVLLQESVADMLPSNQRLARDLAAVLRISTAINAIRKAAELQERVLKMIFEVMPVERAAVLLAMDNSEEFVSGNYRERGAESTEPFRISRTVVRRVFREGIAVIANDILTEQQIQPTESIVASQIRSLLCVPLTVFGSKLGVIYADTTHLGAEVDEHHLHLLTAIASIAAVADDVRPRRRPR